MPHPFLAALFDLDGTLLDTEALCNATGVEACTALGAKVTPAFFEGLAGIDDAERVRLIAAHSGHALNPQAFYAEWDRLTFARLEAELVVKPGARELLTALHEQRLPLALVTSSRQVSAMAKLRAAGLEQFFTRIITVEDVTHPKPAPDAYLAAASALGVGPSRCVVFEDSDTGALAAVRAGCVTVQIPDRKGQTGENATHTAHNLLDGARIVGLLPTV